MKGEVMDEHNGHGGGMTCPCGEPMRVRRTIPREHEIIRVRRCGSCGRTERTVERFAEMVAAREQKVARLLTKQREFLDAIERGGATSSTDAP